MRTTPKLSRREVMEDFVAHSGWAGARITPLAGDASFRRYERVFLNNKQAVLMDAPPEKEDVAPFVNIARYLEAQGFSAPHILAEDRVNGFLLLEDLGDDSYTKLLQKHSEQEETLYKAAIEVLAALRLKSAKPDISLYDHTTLMREIGLFSEWYLPAVAGKETTLAQEFVAIWARILNEHPLDMRVLVLRDYHADNLLWLPERSGIKRVGLLDFQDALIGHPAYDVVSLLEDARRDVDSATVNMAISHYLALTGEDKNDFLTAYALLGAQRNAKIIGIFVRLGVRDGKKHYTRYLPRVWHHFERDLHHPILQELKIWVDVHIPKAWRGEVVL